MKLRKGLTLHFTLIGLSLLLIVGCKKIKVKTQVNRDGSCVRTVSVRGDSSDTAFAPFPQLSEPTWEFVHTPDSTEKGKWIYKASGRFARVTDLNQIFFNEDPNQHQLNIQVEFQKSFRWFSTHYIYKETYKTYNIFTSVPITDYLSEEELELFVLNEDTLDLEEKYEDWGNRTFFEFFFQTLLEKVADKNIPDLDPEDFQAIKEELFTETIEMDGESEEIVQAFLTFCEKRLGTKSVWQLEDDVLAIVQEIEEKINFMHEVQSNEYTNEVIMPGLIIDTNADDVRGNLVFWEIKARQFEFKDYTMWVKSRIVNTWAIAVTAILFLLLLAWLIGGKWLRKT
jgi:hypothetical protein